MNSGLRPIYLSSAVQADFNGDGKMDLLINGFHLDAFATVWRNLGNVGFDDYAELNGPDSNSLGTYSGQVAAGDFYNSGRIDPIVTGIGTGQQGNAIPVAELWRNVTNGTFTLIANAGLPALASGWVAVGDFDNDGRLDAAVAGYTNNTQGGIPRSRVCINLGGGTFSSSKAGLSGIGPLFVADLDHDGYLDILMGGGFWRNVGNGTFTNVPSGLPGNVLALGDFDNDGYLDVVIADGSYQIWRNLGDGTFTNMNVVLPVLPTPPGSFAAVAAVGDYDNDGLPDLVLQAGEYYSPSAQIYRNQGNGTFSNVQAILGAEQGTLTWGDFNNDGRLDFVMTGFQTTDQHGNAVFVAQTWLNTLTNSNAPPTAPTNLTSQLMQSGVKLMWSAATDDHTPSSGLSYNLRVGTTPGGLDIVSPQSDPITGRRLVVQLGNAYERLFSLLTNLSYGQYYWSVQAIDSAYAGGPFASEATFTIAPSITGFSYTNNQFKINFNALATNSYTLQASTNLSTWTNLASTIPTTNGPAQLTDTNTANYSRRYYRLSCP